LTIWFYLLYDQSILVIENFLVMEFKDFLAYITEQGLSFDQVVTLMALIIAGLAVVALIKRGS
jgi:hypothetical protein